MVQRVDTVFDAYSFTPDEFLNACVLTDLTYKYVQTELAATVAARLSLAPDENNPRSFELEHMYMKGKMEALQWILATSDENKQGLAKLAEARASQIEQP